MTTPAPTYTLNDGHEIPALGLGCYQLDGEEGVTAMVAALEAGYRLLDTAVNYGNEGDVGEAVRRSGLPREEVFLTSKIPGRHHAYDEAVASVRGSLETLRTDYLDLQLIHWPNPSVGLFAEAWRALVDLQAEGLVRSIGVSNFTPPTSTASSRRPGGPGGQPGRAAPLLPPGADARRARAPRHPHRVVEPPGQAPGPVRRGAGRGRGADPRRDPRAGDPALAGPARGRADPQVGHAEPPGREPGRLRFTLTDDEVAAISGLARPDGRLFGGDPEVHEEM